LDIDIKGVPSGVESAFKGNRNGYIGHHTDRSPNLEQRIYEVEIATPTGTVFDGNVSFNATFSIGLSMSATSTLTAHDCRTADQVSAALCSSSATLPEDSISISEPVQPNTAMTERRFPPPWTVEALSSNCAFSSKPPRLPIWTAICTKAICRRVVRVAFCTPFNGVFLLLLASLVIIASGLK
jgi:hypothetical protein